MKISVFGLGYVGSVSAACLARSGHDVIGVDVNQRKVDFINEGKTVMAEPGLAELTATAVAEGRLRATTSAADAVNNSELSLICVATPSAPNGSLDTRHIQTVAEQIGAVLAQKSAYHVVCNRSTVLPGTLENILIPALERSSGKTCGVDFGAAINPEFLREGVAVSDYNDPSQIVVGEYDTRSGDVVMNMYHDIPSKRVRTTLRVAETVKYVCNCFHALKIAFANEFGNVCKAHGADGQEVMKIFCNDDKLNLSKAYLRPGYAFGGSCLPKDLRAIVYRAKEMDIDVPVLKSILESNLRQIERAVRIIEEHGKDRIGILGLSFKPGTDDVRESPVIPLIETLSGRGYKVSIYDPIVRPSELIGANKSYLERSLPFVASMMRPDINEVVENSDVVVVTNGWKEYGTIPSRLRPDQCLVDLDGVAKQHTQDISYDGICW
jgi:GDP-mannose 6-dehydrogenase